MSGLNERRDRTRNELISLMHDRNEMLSQYCLLAGSNSEKNTTDQDGLNEAELLQEFCENLIDYLARGQFELYQRITDGKERRQDIVSLAKTIYPRIAESTNYAVDFNDEFDKCEKSIGKFDQYGDRLSKLGEELAIRFELEDQLINSLLTPKAPLKEVANA